MSRRPFATRTPRPLGSIRPSLALAADPVVTPPSRDDGHAPSSLLGLGRDCGAIIRSIQVVSALVDDHRPGELDLVAAGTRGQQILLQHPASAVLRAREDQRSVLARSGRGQRGRATPRARRARRMSWTDENDTERVPVHAELGAPIRQAPARVRGRAPVPPPPALQRHLQADRLGHLLSPLPGHEGARAGCNDRDHQERKPAVPAPTLDADPHPALPARPGGVAPDVRK
jgi:hypothetical protein